jgi:hypothetical protein
VDDSLPRLGADEGGGLQHLPPEWKEVAQSVPDPLMVVGWGQIERESWQGWASGLGTLSPGPPPLPPLKDLLLQLALPLLGGRAVGFSRGPRLVGGLGGLPIGLLLPATPLLGIGGAEVRRSLGAVRSGLKTAKLGRLQRLVNPRVVVAEEMCKRWFAQLQR